MNLCVLDAIETDVCRNNRKINRKPTFPLSAIESDLLSEKHTQQNPNFGDTDFDSTNQTKKFMRKITHEITSQDVKIDITNHRYNAQSFTSQQIFAY